MKLTDPEDFWSGPQYTVNMGRRGFFIKRMRWYHLVAWWLRRQWWRLSKTGPVGRTITSADPDTDTITVNEDDK